MTNETRRCKYCGKELRQATYWYCPEEVVYIPHAAPAYPMYISRVNTAGPAQDTFDMSGVTFFPNAAAAAPSVPTIICVHEPVEPDANRE